MQRQRKNLWLHNEKKVGYMLETLEAVAYNRMKSEIQSCLSNLGSLAIVPSEEEQMVNEILPQNRAGSDYSNLSENAGDRDNQQERLVRLGALIEAEGHITIGISSAGSTRYYMSMYPTIGFTNTNVNLVYEVASILDDNGIKFVLRPSKGRGAGTKRRYDIDIHGHDRVTKTIDLLYGYIKTKREQANILREYIQVRAIAGRRPLGEREWELCKQVRILNGRAPVKKTFARHKAALESPESIRRPRDLKNLQFYVKMCAELQRELERTPETSVPPMLLKWVKK
jgi:hypothetical protein